MKAIIYIVLLSICGSGVARAEKSLMRLFFSPAERAEIEAGRLKIKKNIKKDKPAYRKADAIEIKGYLKRKDQPDVVWVNSNNTLKSNKVLSDARVLKVQKDGKVSIRIDGKGVVKLKPGQLVTRSHKSVQDVYEKHKK
ncbi:MAG: hypothetical protein OEY29_15155 [Gammaproteobacteria bacterium]|nr:hypothetical protein [Gammaproteobacteria bacterium]